ncbi:carboxypeptidase regulatory-like domain-containing protein [Marinilabilia salmonicolor]|jgi:peptidoglycan-associated lipoprotein|uniref:WD40 repeat protein n=1 Tax=Marinilabilia salmonicolor TaxID=989 RepID=A0A2T0XA52_9BACT|nr:carboxypeptidase regulatory-like domain-containing protein [Marinilabilia salmonicolor]PRY95787.1 WD40 repeat protein [Marinilabilia salmonicolor]RCW36563.1 WD40 repeat protein [Marinilabilia salmonicolor]
MVIRILFFLLTGLSVLLLSGCSAEAKLASGVKLYEVGEYSRSVEKFRKMDFDNRYYRAQASYYLAMSYYNIGQAGRASSYFQRAIRYGFPDPVAHFFLGQSLRMREDYEEAIEAYETYLEHDVGNRAALNGIQSCKMALNNPQTTRYVVEENRDLRSRESDYSPAFAGDDYSTVYFSSMRGGDKKRDINQITGQGSSMIYSSIQDGDGGWEDPIPFVGVKDPAQDDGVAAFSSDGKEMFFTRCLYPEEEPMGTKIMVQHKAGGRWGEPEELPLGPDSLVFAHPALSPDGNTLYFVSDMPGGFGGKDLWKVTRSSGSDWGLPENLGVDINTPADEMFPTVRSDGRLYFSSDGLVGYGGLDIFEAVYDAENEEWEIKNLGLPLNSPGHDFGIAFRGTREMGMLSSSRGSYRGVEQIFNFELPDIDAILQGKVVDEEGDAIEGATVRVVGNNGINLTTSTSPEGAFTFVLDPDADYIVMVTASGYFNGKLEFSTVGMEESDEFEKQITLKSVDSDSETTQVSSGL